MSMRMLSGKAIGGPRDGVRLEALPTWDGRITVHSTTAVEDKRGRGHHPGRYTWDPDQTTWVWVADAAKSPRTGTQR